MKIKCNECGSTIESTNGRMAWCECRGLFLDANEYYSRIGGRNYKNYEVVEDATKNTK